MSSGRKGSDLRRELGKVYDVVRLAAEHFDHEAQMNAALHMSTEVRPAPLASAMRQAQYDLMRIIGELAASEASDG